MKHEEKNHKVALLTLPVSCSVVWCEGLLYLMGCLRMVLEDIALTTLMTNSVEEERGVCPESCAYTASTREL